MTPGQMVDYLALVGDTTDNIPGVKGVGEKTASQLLQRWGSLDGIYAHIDEVSPDSVRKKLIADRQSAYLSRELVTLRLDVVIHKGLEEFEPRLPCGAKCSASVKNSSSERFSICLSGNGRSPTK